jgi:hypothetical protein
MFYDLKLNEKIALALISILTACLVFRSAEEAGRYVDPHAIIFIYRQAQLGFA